MHGTLPICLQVSRLLALITPHILAQLPSMTAAAWRDRLIAGMPS
jgi:hypothetical protein